MLPAGPSGSATVRAWWWLCMVIYLGLVAGFLLLPRTATGWLFIQDASNAQIVELTAFYAGNLGLICVLLWRWRHQPRRWLGLVATINSLIAVLRLSMLLLLSDAVDARMLSYLITEAVLAILSWFLRYRKV